MVVTKVERQKKNPSRISLHIDNEYAIGVHKEVLLRSGLRVGDTVTEKTLTELKRNEGLHHAQEAALRLLSYRARSKRELQERLKRKGITSVDADEVLDTLERSGLLNDFEFARSFAHDKLLKKPMGKTMLKQQLRLKGISKELIEQVLSEAYKSNPEDKYAFELALKRIKRSQSSFTKLDPLKKKKRLSDYLIRRGFDWDTVAKAVNRVLGETKAREIGY